MIDPFTAFAAAQTAVSAIKKGIQLGKDIGGISNDLAKFAGAVSDLNFAHKSAENKPWYAVLFGDTGPSAMDIFAKKKQAEALRAEVKQYIQFGYGHSAWEELLHIEAQVRKDRQVTLYRKAEIKQTIIEWVVGSLVVLSAVGLLVVGIYYLGKAKGKW
tara:strand:+ start:898 stop:1374 length:477 start_codon:yes stop_codon:yes gene_type:complete